MVLELQILPPALNVHLLLKARSTNYLLLSFRNLNHLYRKCYFARNPLLSSILSQISTILPDWAIIRLVHRSRSQQLKVYVHPNELSGLSSHSSLLSQLTLSWSQARIWIMKHFTQWKLMCANQTSKNSGTEQNNQTPTAAFFCQYKSTCSCTGTCSS
jgi:hypothetical protein